MTEPERLALVQQMAGKYSLPADLLFAQVLQESEGDPNAFRFEPTYFTRYILNNPKAKAWQYGPLAACSYGLLQIILETAVEIGFTGRPEELFDPATGLDWGAKRMGFLLQWARGNVHTALAAYNAGPGNVGAGLGYADKVYVKAGRTL